MKKQTKKYLVGFLAVLIAIIGIKVIAFSVSQVEPVESAMLTVSEMDWNFGDIAMADGIATKSLTLSNDTSSSVTVTSLQTSCMCTTAQIVHADGSKSGLKGMVGHGGSPGLSETIESGEVVTLLVNFDPNAHGPNATGPITRNVALETNSKAQPEISLKFSGNVIK
ncbi:DUF1573 domain-containing protein [Candidatus Uhrbacteria bacterium]|nr:DUF1573 domain-containing protein [Candidatus Uhrbacteria bacterium]